MDDELPTSPRNDQESQETGFDGGDVWLVSFSETDDRELGLAEIAKALSEGVITSDTIVWREGMAEWRRISQLPELTNALNRDSESAEESPAAASDGETRTGARSEDEAGAERKADADVDTAVSAEPTASGGSGSDAELTQPFAAPQAEIPMPGPRTRSTTALGIGQAQQGGGRDRGSTALGIGRGRTPPPPLPERRPKPAGTGISPTDADQGPIDSAPISIVPDSIPPDESDRSGVGLPRLESVAPVAAGLDERPPLFDTEDDEEPLSIIPESLSPESIKNLPKPPDFTLLAGSETPSLQALTDDQDADSDDGRAVGAGKEGALADAKTEPPGARDSRTSDLPSLPKAGHKSERDKDWPVGEVDQSAHDDLVALASTDDSAHDQLDISDQLLDPPVLELKPGDPGYEAPVTEDTVKEKSSSSAGTWLLVAAVLGGAVFWFTSRDSEVNTATTSRSVQPGQVDQRAETPAVEEQAAAAPDALPEPQEPEAEEPSAEPSEQVQPGQAAQPASPDPAGTTSTSQPADTPQPGTAAPRTPVPTAQKSVAAPGQPSVAAAPAIASPATPAASNQPDAPEPAPEPEDNSPAFNKDEAAAALRSGALRASACRQEGDPSGVAKVTVTFSTSGRATRAVVEGPPFAGTKTGGCIASTMRSISIPKFSGSRVTVSKTVTIR